MNYRNAQILLKAALVAGLIASSVARADEPAVPPSQAQSAELLSLRLSPMPALNALSTLGSQAVEGVRQAGERAQNLLGSALDLVGIRYRRGGNSVESGFDCSGFVVHVFNQSLGLLLPRTSREISKTGTVVAKDELAPGDLVFFNTRRSAYSHVGIYLGDNQFVHAPKPGQRVRVEDMRQRYWAVRYNGARRIDETSGT
jgi:cell wall-associated NlpC family hydrolase